MQKRTRQAIGNEVAKIVGAWAGVVSNEPRGGEISELANALSGYLSYELTISTAIEARTSSLKGFYDRKAADLQQKKCRGRE